MSAEISVFSGDIVDAEVVETAQSGVAVSRAEAERITEHCRRAWIHAIDATEAMFAAMQEAWAGRVWIPLGYPDFQGWVQAELSPDRLNRSRQLTDELAKLFVEASEDKLRDMPATQVAEAFNIPRASFSRKVTKALEAKKLSQRADRYNSGMMGPAEKNRLEAVAGLVQERKSAGLPAYTQMQLVDLFGRQWSQPTIQQDLAFLDAYPGVVTPASGLFDSDVDDDVVDAEIVDATLEPGAFDGAAQSLVMADHAVTNLEHEMRLVTTAQQDRLWDDVYTYRADLAAVVAERLVAVAEEIKLVLTHLGVDVPATQQTGVTVWANDPRPEVSMARLMWAHHTFDGKSIAELAELLGTEHDYVNRMVARIESDPPARRFPTSGAIPKENLPQNLPPEWRLQP